MTALIRPFLALLAALLPLAVLADEVRVAAAGAAKQAIETLAPAFERASGHRVLASYDTVGAQRDRVARGEPVDVAVLSDAALAQLREAGKLAALAPQAIGRVQVGIAVPRSAPLPDLSSAQALREALLAAPSIAYADPARGATAGTHFAKVLDALELREPLRGRLTVLPFGVDVVEAVGQGRYALGISQSSEIVQHPGVRYAGPLPPPHGQGTGYAAAAVADTPAVRQWLAFIASPAGIEAFRASGFGR
ncbi:MULTISPECIES: substrate-binding domain-containing protein [Ramlibacter]|uniref:Molybdate ABC transporter substrate-binding protein n=1 Tax=Ramlibacter pinisoli TaxID=2682844 RepID=A0A6N8J2E3_9BURK|nr:MULTISPECIES: substrate-binding domain-containing protein [Ramlibacter]MBA2962518.1 substrate-binding domain-containing protein [Ramlibacter sp. CGMCC 1.13660]MVQ32460.1 hypothetical protein [Ramlibacter pinisoli]